VTDRIVALGYLLNFYRDKEICITVGDIGSFLLSDPRLMLFFYRRGFVGTLVCLPRESGRSMLVLTADRWAQAPQSLEVALIIDDNRPFITISLPRVISCTVCEQL
jgi:hypothetical protein